MTDSGGSHRRGYSTDSGGGINRLVSVSGYAWEWVYLMAFLDSISGDLPEPVRNVRESITTTLRGA